jgi:hypothetical protein
MRQPAPTDRPEGAPVPGEEDFARNTTRIADVVIPVVIMGVLIIIFVIYVLSQREPEAPSNDWPPKYYAPQR